MNINHALSIRSHFSIGESVLQVDGIVGQAKTLGYESVCLVDTMSISAMVEFTSKCKKAEIKPIIGCTLRVYDDPCYRPPKKGEDRADLPNHFCQIKAYVQSEQGLKSLLRLLSIGNREDHFYYHSRVGWDEVVANSEGLAFSTGDFFSLFHHPDYLARLEKLQASAESTYVEIVPINTPLFDTLNAAALSAASSRHLPAIVAYPALYAERAGAETLDVLRAIAKNTKMDSRTLPVPHTRDFYLTPPLDLARRLGELKDRLARDGHAIAGFIGAWVLAGNEALANSCAYEFKKLPPCLPKMAGDEFGELVAEVKKGWAERFSAKVLGHRPPEEDLANYKARLTHELRVLRKMGFSGYFLLVQDIVRWSKENEIIVGPGRGSVGGSLVAYLMGITDVDPLRFDLLFERFINPDRIDLPDADLDFMSSRRHEVVEYIAQKYGEDRVAGISNYNTLASASALRDAARVFGMEPVQYACSKLVPKEHGIPVTLDEAAKQVPDIERFKGAHPMVWKHSTALEGVMKSLGQHAAGLVVAGEPLVGRSVVETRSERPVCNWDKVAVEDWGLIKMDILGLSTLDVLNLARVYVAERHKTKLDFVRLPLNEPDVMAAFGKGDTIGVFQFESPGMRNLLKQLALGGPLTFDDLVAVVALYRPGPLDAGLCDDYIAIKQGAKRMVYDHPLMEPALKTTYSVIVYQEQVMQVARDLAGFTLTEADHLRKAMGKKDAEKMKEWRTKFVSGAVKSGMEEGAAIRLWEKIEGFAAYCFNKSHSVEYSIISYWTMWLKVRYPAEFYAATMSVVEDDEKLAGLVLDARGKDIEVLPPDINLSTDRMEISGERTLVAPFQAVKGISSNVSAHILKARASLGRSFASKAEFEAIVNKTKVNKAHREKLDRVGAFAGIEAGPPPMHRERLKDRLELMPGFTVDAVKAERGLSEGKLVVIKIISMMDSTRTCEGCSLKGGAHPLPRMGKTPKFMVVFDTPNFQEERKGKILVGDAADYLKAALKDAGLSANDGYYTTLVKSPKPSGQKFLTNEQINGCSEYLKQEIELLRPPVIVPMGSAATRYFAPGVKGSPAELIGKVIYRPDLDASIVFGLNPAQLLFDPSKARLLQTVCTKINEIVT